MVVVQERGDVEKKGRTKKILQRKNDTDGDQALKK